MRRYSSHVELKEECAGYVREETRCACKTLIQAKIAQACPIHFLQSQAQSRSTVLAHTFAVDASQCPKGISSDESPDSDALDSVGESHSPPGVGHRRNPSAKYPAGSSVDKSHVQTGAQFAIDARRRQNGWDVRSNFAGGAKFGDIQVDGVRVGSDKGGSVEWGNGNTQQHSPIDKTRGTTSSEAMVPRSAISRSRGAGNEIAGMNEDSRGGDEDREDYDPNRRSFPDRGVDGEELGVPYAKAAIRHGNDVLEGVAPADIGTAGHLRRGTGSGIHISESNMSSPLKRSGTEACHGEVHMPRSDRESPGDAAAAAPKGRLVIVASKSKGDGDDGNDQLKSTLTSREDTIPTKENEEKRGKSTRSGTEYRGEKAEGDKAASTTAGFPRDTTPSGEPVTPDEDALPPAGATNTTVDASRLGLEGNDFPDASEFDVDDISEIDAGGEWGTGGEMGSLSS